MFISRTKTILQIPASNLPNQGEGATFIAKLDTVNEGVTRLIVLATEVSSTPKKQQNLAKD